MVEFRPHIMTWIPMGESTKEPGTGYEIPGTPGDPIIVPCRFRAEDLKEFRNEDNTVVRQVGRISVDNGSQMPEVGQQVLVTEGEYVHFSGPIRQVYRAQLQRWRLDV